MPQEVPQEKVCLACGVPVEIGSLCEKCRPSDSAIRAIDVQMPSFTLGLPTSPQEVEHFDDLPRDPAQFVRMP